MDVSHCCTSYQAPLQPDDGHDLCPSCLGLEHLKEALVNNNCMNCSYMPMAAKLARLAGVNPLQDNLPPSGQVPTAKHGRLKRGADTPASAGTPPSRKKSRTRPKTDRSRLSSRVDQLSAELDRMRAMLLVHQPLECPSEEARVPTPEMPHLTQESQEPEEDALSLAASASYFHEYEEGEVYEGASQASDEGSRSSAQTELSESEDNSMRAILRMALEKLKVAIPDQAGSAPTSRFFRRKPASNAFSVPHAEDYLRELQVCWADSKACSRLTSDGRALAAMHGSAGVGLDRRRWLGPHAINRASGRISCGSPR
ncbi:LOW QUALITY PROTEIN: uncharacterized protein LOC114481864 [Xyrichtys novacula]|uniref:LOW QUALITY PROTEIN: uncharacterized protein LOC114481864 n=1 Tax=Xyrichtys novacula TaxID=13765 RepID=A0AAV1EXF0_XYRNO|nr:LOW QUALITY PROTEIN: uncharacterized protein LOC114481864 [Xyrichtys novacula]